MTEVYNRTTIYNNNQAFVQWATSVIPKGIKHLNLREKYFSNKIKSKDIKVERILGIINPSDIFTKQIKENTNY